MKVRKFSQTTLLGNVKPNSLWFFVVQSLLNQGISQVALRTIIPWPYLEIKLKHTIRLESHIKTGSENRQIQVTRKWPIS